MASILGKCGRFYAFFIDGRAVIWQNMEKSKEIFMKQVFNPYMPISEYVPDGELEMKEIYLG